MSETVLLSKTSPRQRSQPRDAKSKTTVASTVTAASSVAETGCGRVEKLAGSKGKSSASLAMVKELVHRDNSRLVKDLMALLAIREATKEATVVVTVPGGGSQSYNDEGDVRAEGKSLVKNRPGDTIPHEGGNSAPEEAEGDDAVASLLHHTATKEFSSLAGEIIAIADDNDDEDDDEDDTPMANSSNDVVDASEDIGTGGNDDDVGAMTTMLHADAAAPDLSTSETPTGKEGDDERQQDAKGVFPERCKPEQDETFVGGRWQDRQVQGQQQWAKTDVSVNLLPQRPKCFVSGPVPVSRHPAEGSYPARTSAGTPVPQREAISRPVTLTLEQKLDKLLDSVVKIKADMHRRIDRLGKRVEQIHLDVQLNIDSTDRALLRNDLLLIGIPHREREDLQQCFRAVCRVLEYGEQDIPQVDIRRQRVTATGGGNRRTVTAQKHGETAATARDDGRGGGSAEPSCPQPAPIVVEFMFKTLRDQFYRAYQAKRVLRLSDIGFSSDRRFFVNEVLTKYNQKLMAEAVRRKRLGLLHSVYTVDGVVYVQRVAGEKGTKVTSFSSMN